MEKIRYQVEVKDARKTCVDAVMGKSIFEYKALVSDLRVLQSAFMNLARIMADLADHTGILILDETKISESRLNSEWETLQKLFPPSILSRLRMVVLSDGSMIAEFGDLRKEEAEAISEIQGKLSENYDRKSRRKPDAFFEILRVLLIHWFRGSGPLQVNQLGKLSGFSYPTVASSLEKMESRLIRHSDRSVEIKSFPRDDWFRLLAATDEIRAPQGYGARRPRPVEDLIKRLTEKPDEEVAFGGVIGSRHYLPGIDLVGIPRLDLSVHDWSASKIDKLARKLDPGIKRVESGELPQVVVHNLFRPVSLFTRGEPLLVADEVECLLDLHEARLELQALELLEHLKGQARG
jgi:hypothetical protein